MSNKHILLVEDDITLGDLLVLAMSKRDYRVTWYCRAHLDNRGQLIFTSDRGVESNFDSAPVESQDYDFALVDSRLKGSTMQGLELTKALTQRGLKVIASSGLPSLNEQLIAAGAVGGIAKHEIFTWVFKGDCLLEGLSQRK